MASKEAFLQSRGSEEAERMEEHRRLKSAQQEEARMAMERARSMRRAELYQKAEVREQQLEERVGGAAEQKAELEQQLAALEDLFKAAAEGDAAERGAGFLIGAYCVCRIKIWLSCLIPTLSRALLLLVTTPYIMVAWCKCI